MTSSADVGDVAVAPGFVRQGRGILDTCSTFLPPASKFTVIVHWTAIRTCLPKMSFVAFTLGRACILVEHTGSMIRARCTLVHARAFDVTSLTTEAFLAFALCACALFIDGAEALSPTDCPMCISWA